MNYKNIQRHLSLVLLLLSFLPTAAYSVTDNFQRLENDKQLFARALELSSQSQWAQVESIYRELLERNTNWPEPKNNLAILLFKTNRLDEAKQMLEQAVISSPSYRIAQNNRTQLYNFLATQAYDKALGAKQQTVMPDMQLIQEIYQPVEYVEKIVEKTVEVVVDKTVVENTEAQLALAETAVMPQQITTANDQNKNIEQQLSSWSQAWSEGDFEQYIQVYSSRFEPSDSRKNLAEWKNIRRARLRFSKDVNVAIDQIRIYRDIRGENALVEFVQHYNSKSYADKVLKQLFMQRQQDKWLILSERTIKTY